MKFILPCSPSLLCEDRFDILESDEYQAPFWSILSAILSSKISSWAQLIDTLDTISVTIRGHSISDYSSLLSFLKNEYTSTEDHFFTDVWPTLVRLALDMPRLFPGECLPCLSTSQPQIILSRRQVACLVTHQFLCTLSQQQWETDSSPDFHIWYSSGSGSSEAITAYLHALFSYFGRISNEPDTAAEGSSNSGAVGQLPGWPITFTLKILAADEADVRVASRTHVPLVPLTVKHLYEPATNPEARGIPGGASVVFANKNVGFGQTATQEEMHVGTSPECCPMVLMAPTLQDNEALIVQGAEAMVSMKGYGRHARLDEIHAVNPNPKSPWRHRTMLFIDALELDLADAEGRVPDLLPGNVRREFNKAYAGFSPQHDGAKHQYIVTGHWGCGAFGGNKEIKAILQWCAASMASTSLVYLCCGNDEIQFANRLRVLAEKVIAHSSTVQDLLHVLLSADPGDTEADKAFSAVCRLLGLVPEDLGK